MSVVSSPDYLQNGTGLPLSGAAQGQFQRLTTDDVFTTEDGLPSNAMRCFYEDAAGTIRAAANVGDSGWSEARSPDR